MRHPATRVPSWPAPARTSLLRRSRAVTALTALALTAVLAGCGAGGGTVGATGGNGEAPPGFPVTVTNCGVTTTYQHPPQRAVAFGSTAEIMLALGLADRMVGTAYSGANDILPKYREEYRQIPTLSKEIPSYETLLKANPDFVYGSHSAAFSEQEGRSRKRLRATGINTYLNGHECTPAETTMKHLWGELRTIGKIFNVEQRAAELIGTLKADLAKAKRKLEGAEPVSVFVYDSGTKAPMTAGGHGIGNEIIRMSGGRNIFAGVGDEFFDASWEQVIQRRPEWVVIMDYGSTSVKQKKQTLLSKPALADVPAIKHRRFAVLPLSSAYLGVQAPRAVADLGRQLRPGRFQ